MLGRGTVSPLAVASVIGWRWAELLGHGRLVLAGFIRSTATGSIELTEQTIAALDATDEAPRSRDERSAHVGEDLSDARTAIA